jgi:hypothetical protein
MTTKSVFFKLRFGGLQGSPAPLGYTPNEKRYFIIIIIII